jgi:hypothetical protein
VCVVCSRMDKGVAHCVRGGGELGGCGSERVEELDFIDAFVQLGSATEE